MSQSVIASNLHARIVRSTSSGSTVGGNIVVSIEAENVPDGLGYGSKPVSGHVTRARALAYARDVLGSDVTLCAFLGVEHYRRADGMPVMARRYSVVCAGRTL